MKLVILMHLEDDAELVSELLAHHQVAAYTQLPVEGHGRGTAGWYGKVAPYRSQMLIAFLPAAKAEELTRAIGECAGCSDASHPIHAWQMDVEKSVASGVRASGGGR
jgi:hypothetical protein